jgi:hypothetical protein
LTFKIRLKEVKVSWFKHQRPYLVVVYALTIAQNLRFRASIPTHTGFNAPHDDTLGVRVAKNILDGKWLGSWDNLILAKPPGYSLYLAFAQVFPIEIVVFGQIIFCVIAYLFSRLMREIFIKNSKYGEVFTFTAFTYLIFNPYLFGIEMSRVYRTSTHGLVVLAFLFLVLSSFHCLHKFATNEIEATEFKNRIQRHVFALGLLYCFLVLLRSESYWILVSSLSAALVFFYFTYRLIRKQKSKTKQLRKLIPILSIIFILSYLAPITLIGQTNNTKYGSALIENYYSGNFANALKDWQRVEQGKDPRPYIVVSNEQRAAVYEVSGNAKLLKPYLDLKPGESWLGQACSSPLQLCDNSGPWFPWFLRDAAVATGSVKNEREFQEFFKEISTDIKRACSAGKLECGPIGLGVGAKPIMELPLKTIISYSTKNTFEVLKSTLENSGNISNPDSFGAPTDVIEMYHEVVNYDSTSEKFNELPNYSKQLDNLQKLFSILNLLTYFFGFIGFLLVWRLPNRNLVASGIVLGLMSFVLCVVGVSIAQVSFGWRAEGPYLLPLYPIIQFLTLLGLMSLVSTTRQFILGRKKYDREFGSKVPRQFKKELRRKA